MGMGHYMPLRPHTTRLRLKLNMTQVAAQPSCTMKGSPCLCCDCVFFLRVWLGLV